MSSIHNEERLETCFDQAWEEFRVHNKLTPEMMEELCSQSVGTVQHIERTARMMAEDANW